MTKFNFFLVVEALLLTLGLITIFNNDITSFIFILVLTLLAVRFFNKESKSDFDGGIGLVMKDHLWMPDRNWGYVKFNNPEEVTTEYIKYAEHLLQLIPRGFSAGVYTQITDVEGEVNGLMTYDRKEIKVNEKKIREMNQKICNSLK